MPLDSAACQAKRLRIAARGGRSARGGIGSGQVHGRRFLHENPHAADVDPHGGVGALRQQAGNLLLFDDHLQIDRHHAEFAVGLLRGVAKGLPLSST